MFDSVKFEDILEDLKTLRLDKALKDCQKYEKGFASDSASNKYMTEFIASCVGINKLNSSLARDYAFKLIKIDPNDISKIMLSASYLIENDYENSVKSITDIIQNSSSDSYLQLSYINQKPAMYVIASLVMFGSGDVQDALSMVKYAISEDVKGRFLGSELLIEAMIYVSKNDNARAMADLTNALQLGYKSNQETVDKLLKFARGGNNEYSRLMPIFYDVRTDFIKDLSYDMIYNVVFKSTKNDYYSGEMNTNSTGVTSFASAEKPKERYSDLVDMEDQKDELSKYIIYPLKYSNNLSSYGIKVGGGVLLYGPPGCGKTYVVMATAGEAEVKFIDVKIPDVIDALVGNTEKNIHNLFEYARENSPSILFFDELDALGVSRDETGNAPWMRQAVNTMLSEMNNLYDKGYKVLVVGATNEPWLIDPALRRSGRFGNIMYIPPPTKPIRVKLFQSYLKGKPISDDIDFDKLGELTKGASHSDIKSICEDSSREVWAKSIKSNTPNLPIGMNDLLTSLSKIKFVVPEWYRSAVNYLGDGLNDYPELKDDMLRFFNKGQG
ncbi:ATP-binding protein [Candidatus Mancarchaeum acidiphilum]|nr:ATP-binding protein [Candidatus Mancarchaeum acidiphilum]